MINRKLYILKQLTNSLNIIVSYLEDEQIEVNPYIGYVESLLVTINELTTDLSLDNPQTELHV